MAREFVNTSLYSDANLTHYYRLEGNGNATVGPNGTASNVTFGTTYGKFGQGGQFVRANSSKIAISDSTNFSSAYTVMAWINPASLPTSGNFHFAIGMEKNGFGLDLFNSSGTQQVRSYHTNAAVNSDKGASYNYTLTTGTWYHLAATWTGSLITLYLNGESVATSSWSDIQTNGSTNSNIGAWIGTSPSHFFDGSIDDVAIFSRALTASEVKSIYTSRTFQKDTGNSLNVGLVSYYKLGDTYDFYGSNNLTNNGGATFGAGKYNNGVNLVKASNQYLSHASSMSYSGGAYSLAGWVKLSSQPSSGQYWMFFEAEETTHKSAIFFGIVNNGGTIQTYAGRNKYGVADNVVQVNQTFTTGTWYHCVVTYDGSTVTVYVNGSSVGTTTSSGDGNAGGSNLFTIGFGDIGSTPYTDGVIDEVSPYTKALSTTEISDLYNGGNGQTMNPPIEFDNTTQKTDVSVSSQTFSHTVGTGLNRILFLGIFTTNDSTDRVSGVTYNSVAMTRIDTRTTTANRVYLYYLVNPDSGSNNVVVSTSAGTTLRSHAISYFGAKQSGQPDASAINQSGSSPINTSVTSIVDNCWTVLMAGSENANVTEGTGTILRGTVTTSGVFDSGGPISPAGSNTLSVATSPASNVGTVMASFAPYVASTDLSVNLSDSITISENISTRIDFNINLNDAVTVTENITSSNPDLGGISVSDSITITELVQTISPYEILVFDSVSVSENITSIVPDLGNISVNDAITITESTSMTISDPRRGVIYLNSMAQSFPIPMDSNKQNRPLPMDDTRTL